MKQDLQNLQWALTDVTSIKTLEDYFRTSIAFLEFLTDNAVELIQSPTHQHYSFYRYGPDFGSRLTRPLNRSLFIFDVDALRTAYSRFMNFLGDVLRLQDLALENSAVNAYLHEGEVGQVIYTLQQTLGCIGDSLPDSNQSRKRIGQLFEQLIALILRQVGLTCQSRKIQVPIPDFPGYFMSYELDMVFSRGLFPAQADTYIHPHEIVGSIKTTSKDRLDKIFLDKYLLSKLLGWDVPVVAIFLHDVQRAQSRGSKFGINSTFKSNHFIGYTVALTRLDGVYYVDPRPEMLSHQRLREQIYRFEQFLAQDVWRLLKRSEF
jgi:hypothetical protein